ncbi:MAG: calcium/sodium antiporter [Balneolaceae bacterium]
MATWILPVAALGIGWVLLVWSANKFVTGAATLAERWRLSPLVIGMVVVGFGTSAPELLVSSIASWQGASGIALGNVVGSNILNITLILALAMLLSPLKVDTSLNRVQLPLLLGITVIVWGLGWDGTLSRLEAGGGLLLFTIWVGRAILGSRTSHDPAAEGIVTPDHSPSHPAWSTLLGLVVLLIGSRFLVWGAVDLARSAGLSELVIGLTLVGLGTSLPELASAIVSARRGQSELVLGNIVGSNLFNLLAVGSVAGLIRPLETSGDLLFRDLPVSLGVTLLLMLFAGGRAWRGELQRWEGGVLLCVYLAYTLWLFLG